jgi:acyl carrier protein
MKSLDRIRPLLAERFDVDQREITPERTLESFGIDSLARLELLFELEEAFGIRLDNDAAGIITLGHLVALVESRGETK